MQVAVYIVTTVFFFNKIGVKHIHYKYLLAKMEDFLLRIILIGW